MKSRSIGNIGYGSVGLYQKLHCVFHSVLIEKLLEADPDRLVKRARQILIAVTKLGCYLTEGECLRLVLGKILRYRHSDRFVLHICGNQLHSFHIVTADGIETGFDQKFLLQCKDVV